MCIFEEEKVSRSNVLKKTTESYEEKRLLTWSMSIFEQPVLMKQYKVYQICSRNAYKMTTSKISMYDGIKLYYQQVIRLQM